MVRSVRLLWIGISIYPTAFALVLTGSFAVTTMSLGDDQVDPKSAAKPELKIESNFEGGNAEVVSLDSAARMMRIMPELREERGWPCWWYFKVSGLTVGESITLEVQAQTKPYSGKRVLNRAWCQPKHAWYSSDGLTWKPSLAGKEAADNGIAYTIPADASQIWCAWGPPFVPADAEKLLVEIVAKLPAARRFELARTRGDRPVNGIRIGAENSPRQVWVNARQHAWEVGGSWVGCGFVRWYASEDPTAVELRKQTCLHFLPIMDVDNVALGAGGKDSTPRDHNRDWAAEPNYPEIAAAQRMIREIHGKHGLDVFIDLHNPGADDPIFFFGPFDYEKMTGIPRRNYQRWIDLAATHIVEPFRIRPTYNFATYVSSEEERGRMSSGWVRANTGPFTTSITLETAWNAARMSQEGYQQVGAGLGRTLAGYLKENPRVE